MKYIENLNKSEQSFTHPNFQNIRIFCQKRWADYTPLVFRFLEMRIGKQEKHLCQLKSKITHFLPEKSLNNRKAVWNNA